MRLLFISPTIQHHIHPCLGLGYISSYARSRGYTTRIVDVGALVNREVWTIAEEFDPDVVGISIWCGGYWEGTGIAHRLRWLYPHVIVVAGGPLASYIPAELLERSSFDFVVCGPGEMAFCDLVDRIPRDRAMRESWNEAVSMDHRTINGFVNTASNLDTLPFPDRDPDSRYGVQNSLVTSRGCNAKCIFCANRTLLGCQSRSVENVVAEVQELQAKYGGEEFVFVDDNFAIDGARTIALSQRLGHMGIAWRCQLRADAPRRVIEAMAATGCTSFGVGVESGSPEVLRRIAKGISLQSVEGTARVAHSLGLGLTCYYMLGHYCDTVHTMRQTIDHARHMYETYGANLKFSSNTAFPGSPQYIHRDSLGLVIHATSWDDYRIDSPTVSGRGFTLDELREAFFATSDLGGAVIRTVTEVKKWTGARLS